MSTDPTSSTDPASSRRPLFVHAGVVRWRGRALLLPGQTFSGKSTLTAALVEAGATYYSDDIAVLDGEGRVEPYPKALSLRAQGGAGAARRLPASRLGWTPAAGPVPVGLVVLTRFEPGARFEPRPISPGRATLALFRHTVAARRLPVLALERLSRLCARAPVLEGPRGEARRAAARLLEILDGGA